MSRWPRRLASTPYGWSQVEATGALNYYALVGTVVSRTLLTTRSPRDSKRAHAAHDAEDILFEEGGELDFGPVFIFYYPMKQDTLPSCFKDLLVLLFQAWDDIAGACCRGRGGGLEGERVEGLGLLNVRHDFVSEEVNMWRFSLLRYRFVMQFVVKLRVVNSRGRR